MGKGESPEGRTQRNTVKGNGKNLEKGRRPQDTVCAPRNRNWAQKFGRDTEGESFISQYEFHHCGLQEARDGHQGSDTHSNVGRCCGFPLEDVSVERMTTSRAAGEQ